MAETRAFRIDRDETGRYGNYVRLEKFEPYTDDFRAAELAIFAWRRGTGPVMAPPYVHSHQRILSASLERSEWDGRLLACVDVLFSAPRELHAPLPADLHGRDGYWRDWPTEWRFSTEHDVYCWPSGEDLAAGSYMLASVSLRFPVVADLPEPHSDGADAETCVEAVDILVETLNEVVTPVIRRIEGER